MLLEWSLLAWLLKTAQCVPVSGNDTEETGCICGQKKNLIQVYNIKYCVNQKLSISKPQTHQGTILGGQFAEVNEFPWAAYLSLRSTESGATAFCGGSLISDR